MSSRVINKPALEIGLKSKIAFPFVIVSGYSPDGEPVDVWKPGIRMEALAPDDAEAVCDGDGFMLSEIVGVYKPKGFMTRVFWRRWWQNPDGKVFGGKLQVTSTEKYRRLNKRYMHFYRSLA
jgi:hypothetical protein